jgi:hypothetical protein
MSPTAMATMAPVAMSPDDAPVSGSVGGVDVSAVVVVGSGVVRTMVTRLSGPVVVVLTTVVGVSVGVSVGGTACVVEVVGTGVVVVVVLEVVVGATVVVEHSATVSAVEIHEPSVGYW